MVSPVEVNVPTVIFPVPVAFVNVMDVEEATTSILTVCKVELTALNS